MSRVSDWTVASLPWIVVALVALWTPPLLVAIGANAGLVAGSGYPRLTDPVLVLPIVEVVLLVSAVPRLRDGRLTGWQMLALSRVAVVLQTAWSMFVAARLDGFAAMAHNRSIVEALVGLAAAAVLLAGIRPAYR